MSRQALIAIDLVALVVLAFGLYFPRYGRKDIVVAIVGLNVGVLGVAVALAEADVTAGLGLGLFGVLSIIRLRSSELGQEEVAYYFTALAIGLLAGLGEDPDWLAPTMTGAILVALFVADHPRLYRDNRHHNIVLAGVFADEAMLEAELERTLGGSVHKMRVKKVDLVAQTTSVDVRYRKG